MNTFERIKEEYKHYSDDIFPNHIILDNYIEKFSIPRDGYWFEFGVHSGSTINTLSSFCEKIYGFDSFEGLPEDWTARRIRRQLLGVQSRLSAFAGRLRRPQLINPISNGWKYHETSRSDRSIR